MPLKSNSFVAAAKTGELRGERDNARTNVRCTQARKATHGLDGQHQDVDRTPRGRVRMMEEDAAVH